MLYISKLEKFRETGTKQIDEFIDLRSAYRILIQSTQKHTNQT